MMTPEVSKELADRLWKLATAPTIAPSSVYANACREAAECIRALTADDREKCPVDNPDWNLHRPCPVCGALGPWFENGDCIAPPDATDDSEKDAEIARLRGVLEGLAADFDRARDATPYMAEARRLDKCAKYCRTAALPPPKRAK